MFLCLITATAAAGSVSVTSHAESTLEKLQKAKEEKNKTENAKNDTQEHKQSLEITQNSLLGQLSNLNDNLAEVSSKLQGLEQDIVTKENEISRTQEELAEAVRVQDEQYETMKIRIKYMYERGTDNYLELLFNAGSFSDFLSKSEYVERLHDYDRRMLEQYQQARREVEETKSRLEDELASLSDLHEQTRQEQGKVSTMVKQTANSVADYANQIQDAEATIDQLDDMISQQESDIAALQKQYEEELALSRLAAQSAWRDISEVNFEEGDRYLLANLIYCEAGGEPYAGQVAVGSVVINRVLSSRYPNTVVGVIYQNKQFSPVASGRLALALANNKATASCYQAADEAMSGITNVGQCVYFRTPIEGLTGLRIGGHIFY